jgi:hypothetical protein
MGLVLDLYYDLVLDAIGSDNYCVVVSVPRASGYMDTAAATLCIVNHIRSDLTTCW